MWAQTSTGGQVRLAAVDAFEITSTTGIDWYVDAITPGGAVRLASSYTTQAAATAAVQAFIGGN
ncbi:MAG: hypothetical protein FWF90_11425 [Promicromonosporaceae bacterium]|nr:hypothetical protein [Promicromonosporaceae bacterium]